MSPDQTYPARPCPSCGAGVRRAATVGGGRVVLDALPHKDGDVVLMPGGAMVLSDETLERGKRIGARRYLQHACPGPKGG